MQEETIHAESRMGSALVALMVIKTRQKARQDLSENSDKGNPDLVRKRER